MKSAVCPVNQRCGHRLSPLAGGHSLWEIATIYLSNRLDYLQNYLGRSAKVIWAYDNSDIFHVSDRMRLRPICKGPRSRERGGLRVIQLSVSDLQTATEHRYYNSKFRVRSAN